MQNNFILKNKNNEILSFYYGEEKCIYLKKLSINNELTTHKVAQNVMDCFTVTLSPDKEVYVFCQSYDGDIILCKLEEGTFKNKILFKNKSERLQNIMFYPIFFKENMSLVYNTYTQNNNEEFLAIKTLIGGKEWTNSENIDTFTTLPNSIFYMHKINEQNMILAYQKKKNDIEIGYKEIKNGNISDFITMHKTGYQIVDYSFVCFDDSIHYLYVIKNLFSSQIIYRKKDRNGISNPIVLFEGQKIKSCVISILDSNIYCSFVVNSTLYYCQSQDFGNTFLNIAKYRKPIYQDIIKAKFLYDGIINNSSINDIYIDGKNLLNIYLLPDFLPHIFSMSQNTKMQENNTYTNKENFIKNLRNQFIENINSEKDTIKENNIKENNINKNKQQPRIVLENDFMSNFNLEQFSNFNINKEVLNMPTSSINNKKEILENKVKMLEEQLNEKNSQILKLNQIMQNKNDEKIDIEIQLRQKIRNVENENKELIQKISNLEKNINKSNDHKGEDIEKNDQIISDNVEQDKKD